MSECKYKNVDGVCKILSDDDVKECCVEGPCTEISIGYIRREDAVIYVLGLIDRIYEGTIAPRDIVKNAKQNVLKEMISTDRLPAADVRENVHARWIRREGVYGKYYCENCGRGWKDPESYYIEAENFQYCPICGADMHGGRRAAGED